MRAINYYNKIKSDYYLSTQKWEQCNSSKALCANKKYSH